MSTRYFWMRSQRFAPLRLHPNSSSSRYGFIHELDLYQVQDLSVGLNRQRDQSPFMELDRYLLRGCLSDRSMFK
ncbi:unnamed protein product [Brassica rapa]|uniref:Uncharacterized protein n=1 Tax=Brassica campestris TaxID=3711 RepID=A0A8D9CV58_BRACM|nr:unnamed protein product [Brassica rapa]